MSNKICGLFLVHVDVSEHNDNGKCPCLDCAKNSCATCTQYNAVICADKNALMRGIQSKCDACKFGKQR